MFSSWWAQPVVHAERLSAAVLGQALEAALADRDARTGGQRLEPELDQGRLLGRIVDIRFDRVRVPGEGEEMLGIDRRDVHFEGDMLRTGHGDLPGVVRPGTNGWSSRTWNEIPNSSWSVSAFQTRDRGGVDVNGTFDAVGDGVCQCHYMQPPDCMFLPDSVDTRNQKVARFRQVGDERQGLPKQGFARPL